jgi:hypothetical protein
MGRSWFLCICVATAQQVAAQQAVPVHQEPRHHLVLDRSDLRVLDVKIPPGDTTLFHTHANPIHYVTVAVSVTTSQALGREWPRPVRADGPSGRVGDAFWTLEYARSPLTHRVANIGDGLFRLIAVTNLGSGGTSTFALPGALEAESQWFRRSRLTLPPGGTADLQTIPSPILIVQVTPGQVEVRQPEGRANSSSELGGWLLAEPGRTGVLANPGSSAVVVVLVQVLK